MTDGIDMNKLLHMGAPIDPVPLQVVKPVEHRTTNTPSLQTVRLECLRLAVQLACGQPEAGLESADGEDLVALAEEFVYWTIRPVTELEKAAYEGDA